MIRYICKEHYDLKECSFASAYSHASCCQMWVNSFVPSVCQSAQYDHPIRSNDWGKCQPTLHQWKYFQEPRGENIHGHCQTLLLSDSECKFKCGYHFKVHLVVDILWEGGYQAHSNDWPIFSLLKKGFSYFQERLYYQTPKACHELILQGDLRRAFNAIVEVFIMY